MLYRVCFLLCLAVGLPAQDFDTLIIDVWVVDGTGNPSYIADVGIRDGRIAAIGEFNFNSRAARRTIDAAG